MWKWLLGQDRPSEPQDAPPAPAIRQDKVDFHIRRFTLALEQCEKGREREAELQRNLDYWLAIKAAQRGLEG